MAVGVVVFRFFGAAWAARSATAAPADVDNSFNEALVKRPAYFDSNCGNAGSNRVISHSDPDDGSEKIVGGLRIVFLASPKFAYLACLRWSEKFGRNVHLTQKPMFLFNSRPQN